MLQAQESEIESHDPDPVSLEFPTIPVHGTPASWLSQSQLIIMTSTHEDSSCDDTSSSLGDSGYEFIDERSNATTDDEEQDAMTESTTSSDDHELDQVNVLPAIHDSDRSSDNRDLSHPSQAESFSTQVAYPSSAKLSSQERTPRRPNDHLYQIRQQEEQETIDFEEPSITSLKSSRGTEVSRILKVDDWPEILNAHHRSGQGPVTVTIRQTMTSSSLDLGDRSYKVLYVGNNIAKEPILQKIGTALAAMLPCSTPPSEKGRSSKFNVVPISAFGEAASPEVVLIDSSGIELIVEECGFASFTRREGGNDTISMSLSDVESVESYWTGSKFAMSKNWRIPDIAIFYISGSDNVTAKQTRRFARSFMSRHAVQSIVVCQDCQSEKPAEAITLDYLTPHICMEYGSHVVRRLPIDLMTFLKLDASQMNRNLACLANARGSSRSLKGNRFPSETEEQGNQSIGFVQMLRETFCLFTPDIRQKGMFNRYNNMAGLAIALISISGILLLGIGFSELLGASRVSKSRVFPTSINSPSVSGFSSAVPLSTGSLSLSHTSTLSASLAPPVPAQVSPVKSLSTDNDFASFLLNAYALAPIKSEQFKIHVLGDCHVVLRLPHWLTKMRKSPALLFRLTRGNSILNHDVSSLFDGVYALQIPREEAYGKLNVSVWTEAKPMVDERFEVDFGSSWLNSAGWKRATRAMAGSVRGEISSVQKSLSTTYDRTRTDISTFIQSTKEKAAARREAERAFLSAQLKLGAETKDVVIAQTKALARNFSSGLGKGIGRSEQMTAYATNLRKDMVVYTRSGVSIISQQARCVARTASSVRDSRGRQLRETQKRALKMWWKVSGLPGQKSAQLKAREGGGGEKEYMDRGL